MRPGCRTTTLKGAKQAWCLEAQMHALIYVIRSWNYAKAVPTCSWHSAACGHPSHVNTAC